MSTPDTVEDTTSSELILGFDAMRCPSRIPTGARFAMPYVFGSSAAHIWTMNELNRVAHMPVLPICVPTPGLDNPRQAAIGLATVLERLGYPRNTTGDGKFYRVLWDLETGKEPDPGWVNVACDYLLSAGWFSEIYGSPSWEFGQPHRAGYFVADPTGKPHLYPAPGVNGTQYMWNANEGFGTFDRDCATKFLFDRMGRIHV